MTTLKRAICANNIANANSDTRHNASTKRVGTPSDDTTNGFVLPIPSQTSRKISWRSRGSCRGTAVLRLNGSQQIVVYESLLELMCILLITTRVDVLAVWDQPPAIRYRRPDGTLHEHTFDYLIELETGPRYAIAIKPKAMIAKRRFDIELGYVAAAMPENFADDVILLSEADFTRAQALNAQRYHEFAKSPDIEADKKIMRVASQAREPRPLADLIDLSGLAGRGFRAAFRAIIEGRLSQLNPGKIGLQTLVSAEGLT